jgi:hypothetical protein
MLLSPHDKVTTMAKACLLATTVLLSLITTNATASIVLADFETGAFPGGWTVTPSNGTSWQVGQETNSSPNVKPADPLVAPFADGEVYFAFSGRPNVHLPESSAEEDTGVIMSSAFIVNHTILEWLSVGWSGGDQNGSSGENYFQILDGGFAQKALIQPAQNDGWEAVNVNLLDIGLSAGDTFYFRAVDGRSASSYGWIGFDNLTLTGAELEIPTGAVPEATGFLIWGLIGLTFAAGGWKRRERS